MPGGALNPATEAVLWAWPASSTSASASCMPSLAKASAMARPRPLAAPVTTASLPCSESAPGMPEHRCAAEEDQRLEENNMQPGADARNEPRGDGAARNGGEADHRAGGCGL